MGHNSKVIGNDETKRAENKAVEVLEHLHILVKEKD